MNRRSFLNSVGVTILGTAIALKIPEILVSVPPKVEIFPDLIADWYFRNDPFIEYMKRNSLIYNISA